MTVSPALAVAIALTLVPPVLAAPEVTSLFPAGGQRGESVQVTATGGFPEWPVEVWVDRPGITVTAAEKKETFDVRIDANAAPGVYWLRAHSATGASGLRPFVVGNTPEAVENEPNERCDTSQKIELPRVVNGRLGKNGDVDCFAVELQAGQSLVAAVDAHWLLGSPMDAIIQVCDPQGFVLQQNHDARGLDPLLIFSPPESGQYVVRVFAFPSQPNSSVRFAGGFDYVYRLTLSTGPVVDHALPLATSDTTETSPRLFGWNLPNEGLAGQLAAAANHRRTVFAAAATGTASVRVSSLPVAFEPIEAKGPVAWPATYSGRLAQPGEIDRYGFKATKGQKIALRVRSRELGFPLDPVLVISDTEGNVIKEIDDVSRYPDPRYDFVAPSDGVFFAQVRDLHGRGGLRFVYELTISESQPDFTLSLSADQFVLKTGESLEIEVAIARLNAMQEEIVVEATGLPDEVSATTASSVMKKDSEKKVTLVLTAKKAGVRGTFQVTGRSGSDESSLARTAHFSTPAVSVQHTQAWLTVTAMPEPGTE